MYNYLIHNPLIIHSMKKLLQNSPILVLAICLLLINSNVNAQSFGGINIGNLGSYNIDSLNKLKDNFTDFQSLTDSLTNVVSNQLADTSLVDPKIIDSLNNQIAGVSIKQDSILKLISDSTNITQDSLAILQDSLLTLQNQNIYLQNKQDSLSQVFTDSTGLDRDSLMNVYNQLQIVESNTDSLQQVFLNNMANLQTFNQDSLDKAREQLMALQEQMNEAINKPTGIEDIESISFSLYPNPAIESFSINSLSKIIGVKIYNLSGNLIKSFDSQDSYNVANLDSGLYLVSIQFANTTSVVKLNIL